MLQAVEIGSVTITGAISEGEKQIARAIREAGWPMVVLLKDGFPAEGSPNERFFKPSGVYYEACAAGRLLLLEPTSDTFILPAVQKRTEEAIRHKAEENHYNYSSVPVDSQRYRFMAMNQMAQILAERFCDEREMDGEKG